MKSKEEIWINILKEAKRREDLIYRVVPETSWTYPIAELVYKAMEEYASQFTVPASPLPISGDALAEAERLYPLANPDDYPENPDVNRLNRACQSAFINGLRHRDVEVEKLVNLLKTIYNIRDPHFIDFSEIRETIKPYQSPVKEII